MCKEKTCDECRRRQKVASTKYIEKEGYCVYSAVYPEGEYIGSGRLVGRRGKHLSGNARISKALGSKALEFNILHRGPKEQCVSIESYIIQEKGIENLLNTGDVNLNTRARIQAVRGHLTT